MSEAHWVTPEPRFGDLEQDDRDPIEVVLDDLRSARHITQTAYDMLTGAAMEQAASVVAATLWTVLESEEARHAGTAETAGQYRKGVLMRLREAATHAQEQHSDDEDGAEPHPQAVPH